MKRAKYRSGPDAGLVYIFGFIGAAVYYIKLADTFATGALGIAKALVWPATLVFKAFIFFSL